MDPAVSLLFGKAAFYIAMIDKTNVVDTVCDRLRKLPGGECIDLRTYKRNRSVLIIKENDEMIKVIEDGFYKETFQVPIGKFRKTLRTLLRKEFPRSRKIRVYSLGMYREGAQGIERKKL